MAMGPSYMIQEEVNEHDDMIADGCVIMNRAVPAHGFYESRSLDVTIGTQQQ
jgi:hypothetical protein